MASKEEIGEIMHGLSNKNIQSVETSKSSNVYFNVAKFPKLTEMQQAILLIPTKIKNYEVNKNVVTINVEGHFFKQDFIYRYFDFRPFLNELKNTRNIAVKLTFTGKDTIRIQASEGFKVPINDTEMIRGFVPEEIPVKVSDEDEILRIFGGDLEVTIDKKHWNLQIADRSGKVFYKQFGEDNRSFMKHEICPFGFLYDGSNNEKLACEAVFFDDDEHFYGFGEKFMNLDRKGRNINLWNTNALGTNTERAYKNIPFFISSKNYGIFYNTSAKIQCDMGNTLYKAYSVMVGSDNIDYFVIRGKNMKEIIPRYTDITGKPNIPPKWSFGIWMSKISYGTREEVETVAKKMREEQIPCDVIHIDTDWFNENWICDWKFSDKKFPKVKEMIDKLSEKGYKISLWQLPYIERGTESYDVYDEGVTKGYFASAPEGSMEFPHGIIDFSNPEAVEWYKNKLIKPLLELGIKAIKVDFGESAPPFFQYSDVNGNDMHNLYALLYNKAAYEITEEVLGKENALIWARSAWAGSQRYPLHWGGDAGTDMQAMAYSLKGCLSIGISGFPFWSSDIGGFWFESNPKLFARWSEFGMFCSHARAHGFFTREPWAFGSEVKNIYKRYAELRYKLMPYIYSQAVSAVKTSLPMHKALVIEYPNDPTVANIDWEYLFGDNMLIAPVMNENDLVTVYLPEGIWTDYWTKKQYKGRQWIKYAAPLDVLPIFIRENAIIPMGPVMQYVDEKPLDTVTLDLYPINGISYFTIYDGGEAINIKMTTSENIVIEISTSNKNFKLIINNISVTYAEIDGKAVTVEGQNTLMLESNAKEQHLIKIK